LKISILTIGCSADALSAKSLNRTISRPGWLNPATPPDPVIQEYRRPMPLDCPRSVKSGVNHTFTCPSNGCDHSKPRIAV
jgi:hypothetical protein